MMIVFNYIILIFKKYNTINYYKFFLNLLLYKFTNLLLNHDHFLTYIP